MVKNVHRLSISVVIACIAICAIYVMNNNLAPKHTESILSTYSSEVKDPKWSIENSDLIVIGEIDGKDKQAKGKDTIYGRDAVYEDTNVCIKEIVKNSLKEDLEVGDKISVRVLGGTVNNYELRTDTLGLLPSSGDVLLCLVDGAKTPGLPVTENKKVYAVVGGIHGAFNLTSDGLAKREKVNDSFNLNDLIEKNI